MALKVIWSEFAENQLDKIYAYYEKKASPQIAKKLLHGIVNEPEKLKDSPLIGQQEEFLKERDIHYRYLIFKSYKLIYYVDTENGFIKIADVFDTQQKLNERSKSFFSLRSNKFRKIPNIKSPN